MAGASRFPGHMARARRLLREQIKRVDLVLELLDARIPHSSASPALRELAGGKQHLIVLNKADLADPVVTRAWQAYFRQKGSVAISLDARRRHRELFAYLAQVQAQVQAAASRKGRRKRPLRFLIAGIPNVGKSTLLNTLAGRKAAATGDKPGVTRGEQWVRLPGGYELLDTPGVLWPAAETEVTFHLAVTGALVLEAMELEAVARKLGERLALLAPEALWRRYGLDLGHPQGGAREKDEREPFSSATTVLEEIGRRRGFLLAGGRVDLTRAAQTLLGDFRAGYLGRLSLERPPSATEPGE